MAAPAPISLESSHKHPKKWKKQKKIHNFGYATTQRRRATPATTDRFAVLQVASSAYQLEGEPPAVSDFPTVRKLAPSGGPYRHTGPASQRRAERSRRPGPAHAPTFPPTRPAGGQPFPLAQHRRLLHFMENFLELFYTAITPLKSTLLKFLHTT